MKKIKHSILITLSVTLVSAFTLMQSINYKVKDGEYAVTFKGGKVDGVMSGLKASIHFNESSPETSKIIATVDATTINTGNGLMNKHAKAENALNTSAFSIIGFESTSITGKNGSYTAIGKLTLKDVTKEIKLPFTFEHKGAESLFKGTFTIVPEDFHVTKMGKPDLLEIILTIPVTI